MTLAGGLIAESLRDGGVLEGVALAVTKIWRANVGDIEAGQPSGWTFVEFEAADEDAERLARALEDALEPTVGWYCDFHSESETFVVFSGRTFRYRRGDASGRSAAAQYGRSVGVPEAQLDWTE